LYLCSSPFPIKTNYVMSTFHKALEPEQKALEINLDDYIYGTFSEVGAGQEVARYFFRVGAAAGTIAKTMSAYDKVYSDCIYGPEPSGRYVSESRLYKMLDHEYDLMLDRLRNERPDTNFFVFADTVAAINFQKTIKGSGWLGLRFQLDPKGEPNDIVLHVQMRDNDNSLQQQAIGILGVNLVYACYRYYDQPETLVVSLMDQLHGRVWIDMLRLTGPNFAHLDNRLISLWLVKNDMCDVAMFDQHGKNIHPSEFLYKKNLMVVRGSYRPPTLVNQNMVNSSYEQFLREPNIDPKRSMIMVEITLDNLRRTGLDEQDFLDRTNLLGALGVTTMITNCEKHHKLIAYLADFRVRQLGIVLGAKELLETINEKYYQNLNGSLLAAFGELFTKNVKIYVYPAFLDGSDVLMTTQNLPVPYEMKFLYKYLLDSNHLEDVIQFNPDYLHIYSKEVLRMIGEGEAGWEAMVPTRVAELVKERGLFGYMKVVAN
jgi:hypothetical protein